MTGALMASEIAEQPEVFERVLSSGREAIAAIAAQVREAAPRFVLFVARGTSDHAALYGKYLFETRLGLPVGLASPSTLTIYESVPRFQNVLVIAISQSGGSPDLTEFVRRARGAGALTLSITNAPESAVANASQMHLNVLAGQERAVAATKSYTAQLLSIYLLMEALSGSEQADANALPARARQVLAQGDEVSALAQRYRFADQMVITSRGYNYPTALETALKLMETSYLVAHGFSAADLLHGPMAMIDRGFPVVMLVPEGKGGQALSPVIDALQEVGADTFIVGAPSAAQRGSVGLSLVDLGPEILSPLLLILPMQQLALHLATARGVDPDTPRGLNKITQTW
jgi:glucosamine--fructose-6-phosphate aminotransferase (isomerizing)